MDFIKKERRINNAEKRRERSKVAARCRRGKECEIFADLCKSLPLPQSIKSNLDKASIMRLTLTHFGLNRVMNSCHLSHLQKEPSHSNGSNSAEFESQPQLNEALGGFIIVLGMDGDVIYASEGVTEHLGISQYEFMGHSIFDFSHQFDHNDIRGLLLDDKGLSGKFQEDDGKKSCQFRMKCSNAISSRGGRSNNNVFNHKMFKCTGRIVQDGVSNNRNKRSKWFIAICESLLIHPHGIFLCQQTYWSKHSLDMKFKSVDDDLTDCLGYTKQELLGRSLFEFSHALDGESISKSFTSLSTKGQTQTDGYRFLTKGGGWRWVVTEATVNYGSGGSSPSSVTCIHTVISGREEVDQILSLVQIGERRKVIKTMTPEEENDFILDLLGLQLVNESDPGSKTSKTFVSDTKDDNYLNLSIDSSLNIPLLEDLLLTSFPNSDNRMEVDGQVPKLRLTPPTQENPFHTANFQCPPINPMMLNVESSMPYGSNGNISSSLPEFRPLARPRASSLGSIGQRRQQQRYHQRRGSQMNLTTIMACQDGVGSCINQNPSSQTGPQPIKIQKLEELAAPNIVQFSQNTGQNVDAEWDYLLIPVQQERRDSNFSITSSSSGYGSDSCNNSDDEYVGGQVDLLNLVRAQQLEIEQQVQINLDLLASMKMDEICSGTRRNSMGKRDFAGSLLTRERRLSLQDLSPQDCEINAPLLRNDDLLLGPDLLQALEIGAQCI